MRHIVAGAVAAAALVLAPGAAASTVVSFRTPTGNIGCEYTAGLLGGGAPSVRCDIRSGLRPRPHRPARCPLDYGDSLEISRTGRARILCHGDTVLDSSARVLDYGRTWVRGGFSCVSQFVGLRCSNPSGHGFFLSRQTWHRY